ncbi:hypothetical protein [Azonexus sp.]|uniref:hypothetical protein n=1 Tax=Azonexus sp. TaxID=1872668 RepID=UPI0027BA6D52|nr:hypothetical protein [Azonexus sp.]
MKIIAYLVLLSILGSITWKYPFLFELPLIGAIAGAYWLFFRQPDQNTKPEDHQKPQSQQANRENALLPLHKRPD